MKIQRQLISLLARRPNVERQSVDAASELIGQQIIDRAMTLDPALSRKTLRHDLDAEMRLAAMASASLMTHMTRMLMRFVDYPQKLRRKCGGEFFFHHFPHRASFRLRHNASSSWLRLGCPYESQAI
jgi:hypothetical protein